MFNKWLLRPPFVDMIFPQCWQMCRMRLKDNVHQNFSQEDKTHISGKYIPTSWFDLATVTHALGGRAYIYFSCSFQKLRADVPKTHPTATEGNLTLKFLSYLFQHSLVFHAQMLIQFRFVVWHVVTPLHWAFVRHVALQKHHSFGNLGHNKKENKSRASFVFCLVFVRTLCLSSQWAFIDFSSMKCALHWSDMQGISLYSVSEKTVCITFRKRVIELLTFNFNTRTPKTASRTFPVQVAKFRLLQHHTFVILPDVVFHQLGVLSSQVTHRTSEVVASESHHVALQLLTYSLVFGSMSRFW